MGNANGTGRDNGTGFEVARHEMGGGASKQARMMIKEDVVR